MASDYVKQHYRFWFSSIRDAPPFTRLLFMAMWNLCDERGHVEATPGALAAFANLPLKDVQDSLALLAAPDPNSTSPEHEGARIVSIGPNKWHVINFEKYRDENASMDRRTYWKEKKREQRESEKAKKSETNLDGPGLSPNVPIYKIRAQSEENDPSGLERESPEKTPDSTALDTSRVTGLSGRRRKSKPDSSTSFPPEREPEGTERLRRTQARLAAKKGELAPEADPVLTRAKGGRR